MRVLVGALGSSAATASRRRAASPTPGRGPGALASLARDIAAVEGQIAALLAAAPGQVLTSLPGSPGRGPRPLPPTPCRSSASPRPGISTGGPAWRPPLWMATLHRRGFSRPGLAEFTTR